MTASDLDPPEFPIVGLEREMARSGVGRAVLVNHDIFYGPDNRYILDCVARAPDRYRATAILDEEKEGLVPGELAAQMRRLLERGATSLRIDPWVNGPAMMAQERKPAGWLHDEVWEEAASSSGGQTLCLLIDPADMADVDAMCARHPGTNVAIDHFARIGVSGDVNPSELEALVALARHDRVNVKLSAFYAVSGFRQPPYNGPGNHVIPMIRELVNAYGCDRYPK